MIRINLSETTAIRSSSSAAAEPAPAAVLLLDATGRVTAANASARALWQTGEAELVGEAFAALFAFEIVSSDPEFLEAQWEALLISGLDKTAALTAQPREGAPREVRVRLEKNLGSSPGYIAVILPPPAPVAAGAAGGDDRLAALSLLADKGSAGFFDLHLAAGRVLLSPAWKKIVGYTPSELPDTMETWMRLVHPEDSAATPDKVGKKLVVGARPFSVEFRMKHRRGDWVWVQCVGLQVMNATGELERVVGFTLDITDRKLLEEESIANDARLQDLSGGGPMAAFELDFAGKVFWFSPAWEKLLGYGDGELAPEPASFAAALPPEEAAAGVETWLLQRAPGQSSFAEAVRLRAKDGRPVPALFAAHRTLTRKRDLSRVVGFAVALPSDLSTAASPEGAALPAALVTEAFGALAEGVLITDARGQIIYANPASAPVLRLAPEVVRGQPIGDVFRLVNRQSNRPGDDPVERALSADHPLPLIGEDALASPVDGQPPTPIVWTARAAFGADGKPIGVAVAFRDPEQMTLTPEELVKANRFESLGLLAGGIAHDFNNLLTTILGAVSLAKDNRDYTSLADAEQACVTAKGLTRQLLAFAKGGSGTQVECASREIMDDALKIAAAASTATIDRVYGESVDPVTVDRSQILQVFQNLIVNALQAMPPPPHRPHLIVRADNVTLAEEQVASLAAGDYVLFEVRDNGSGIKPEHVNKIFDPFFTTKKHGTGLGLATVLKIVRQHGGQLELATEVGVGTAFTVYLPKAEKPVAARVRQAASLRFGTGRLLFMDDDLKITALTSTMLTSLDYKFDTAKNGEEAIALYKRYLNIGRPYDAVIMDLTVVGGMGGEECFKVLKSLDPDVRAIVSTGYDNDDMNRKFIEMGFCDYLTKPYRVTDLGKKLKDVLGK